MLTIGQLARYGGTTARAVRHYHQLGLLAEPERTRAGYRTYGVDAVVRLIRIRTLAAAGVPLARVQELLDAAPEDFARGVEEIDAELRAEIRRLQEHRRRIAELAAGDGLTLPQSVVDYLDRLRRLGVAERYIVLERDAWIMLAAQVPDTIDAMMADKQAQLDDPDTVRLYQLLSEAVDWSADDPRVVELVDLLERLMLRYLAEHGGSEMSAEGIDQPLVDLLDAMTADSAPAAARMIELLEERGWEGWTRIERVPEHARLP